MIARVGTVPSPATGPCPPARSSRSQAKRPAVSSGSPSSALVSPEPGPIRQGGNLYAGNGYINRGDSTNRESLADPIPGFWCGAGDGPLRGEDPPKHRFRGTPPP